MQGPPPLDEKVGKMGKAHPQGGSASEDRAGPWPLQDRSVHGLGGAGGSSEDLQGPHPGQPHS